jgi:hypothetical protein
MTSVVQNYCKGVKNDGDPCTRSGASKYQGYCPQHNNQINGDSQSVFQQTKQLNYCKGLKLNGEPCKRSGTTKYQGYCSYHFNQLNGQKKKITFTEAIKLIEQLTIDVNTLKCENMQMYHLIKTMI